VCIQTEKIFFSDSFLKRSRFKRNVSQHQLPFITSNGQMKEEIKLSFFKAEGGIEGAKQSKNPPYGAG
jgi:hypothetical protein